MAAGGSKLRSKLTADHAFGVLLGLVLLAGAFHLHEVGITLLLPLEQSAGQRSARAVRLARSNNRSLLRIAPTEACAMAMSCPACLSVTSRHCRWEGGRCVPGLSGSTACDRVAFGTSTSTSSVLANHIARVVADAGLPKEHVQILHGDRLVTDSAARPSALEIGATHSRCAHRKPYHVVLTAASGTYQEWQTRIAYYHYRKLKVRPHP